MNIDFKRQTLIFDPEKYINKTVGIIGLGNIGSHAAMALARLGIHNFELYDPDTVEPHNLSSQSYGLSSIGSPKVHAVRSALKDINSNIIVSAYPSEYMTELHKADWDVAIIAVDSMKGRMEIFDILKSKDMRFDLLIDGRVGGNQLEVYNCKTREAWKNTFSDPRVVSHDPCGGRYISYVSMMIGAIIANQVKKYLNEEAMDDSIVMDANALQVVKNISWN